MGRNTYSYISNKYNASNPEPITEKSSLTVGGNDPRAPSELEPRPRPHSRGRAERRRPRHERALPVRVLRDAGPAHARTRRGPALVRPGARRRDPPGHGRPGPRGPGLGLPRRLRGRERQAEDRRGPGVREVRPTDAELRGLVQEGIRL